MTEPRYQHTAEELRYVANILDTLNAKPSEDSDVACSDGVITVWWMDREMGEIYQDCDEDPQSWAYFPVAKSTPMEG